MWIKTQDGVLVNLDNSVGIEVFGSSVNSYYGYDSLEHDHLFDTLGKYIKTDPSDVKESIYDAIQSGLKTFTMPKDGE